MNDYDIFYFCSKILAIKLKSHQKFILKCFYPEKFDYNDLMGAEYIYAKSYKVFNESNYSYYGFNLSRRKGKTFLLTAMIAYETWLALINNKDKELVFCGFDFQFVNLVKEDLCKYFRDLNLHVDADYFKYEITKPENQKNRVIIHFVNQGNFMEHIKNEKNQFYFDDWHSYSFVITSMLQYLYDNMIEKAVLCGDSSLGKFIRCPKEGLYLI